MPPFTIYYLNKCSFARIVTILLPFGSINNSSSLNVFISIKATMYTITAMMIKVPNMPKRAENTFPLFLLCLESDSEIFLMILF